MPEFSRWGMTMRTPAGPVDLVPLQRRLEGDKTALILDDERDAAVLALTHLGVPCYQVNKILNLADSKTKGILARFGMRPVMATQEAVIAWTGVVQTPRAERRARRLAERIEVDGRLFHRGAPHGTDLGYTDYGCRCEPCTGAHAAKLRSDRDKKRTGAAA